MCEEGERERGMQSQTRIKTKSVSVGDKVALLLQSQRLSVSKAVARPTNSAGNCCQPCRRSKGGQREVSQAPWKQQSDQSGRL